MERRHFYLYKDPEMLSRFDVIETVNTNAKAAAEIGRSRRQYNRQKLTDESLD